MKKILIVISSLVFFGCGDDEKNAPLFKQIENLNMDNISNYNTIVESSTAHSGKKICHIDSGNRFGLIYTFLIPDSLVGKNLVVNISAWIRTGNLNNNCDIICSVSRNDSILLWQGCNPKAILKTPNEWSNLTQGFVLNPKLIKPNTTIYILLDNVDAKSYFDIDDLVITYSEPNYN